MTPNEKTEAQVSLTEEVIDIEEYAAKGQKPPKGEKYKIKIDKTKYVVEVPEMLGREILELAGKTPPGRFQINQKFKGGQVVPIDLDQVVDFTAKGVEKFMTVPLDQQEG